MEPSGEACVQLQAWKCNNDWMPFVSPDIEEGWFCMCNDDTAGPPQDAGTHYECK